MQRLAQPGAGLPPKEKFFIHFILIPSVRVLFTWDIALWYLKREVSIIKKLLHVNTPNLHTKQVIIDRTFAIEDDSRRYSLNMVLEHLTITGNGVLSIIKTLSEEKEFPQPITIEGVKPHQNKIDQLQEFLEFYESYFAYIKDHPKKRSHMTKPHPWFGAFNNFDWHVFMFMHTFIHRRQIEAIIERLGGKNE